MAQRQQQPIVSCLFISGIAAALVCAHFAPDLYSPMLFMFKAVLQPITMVVLIALLVYALYARKKMITAATFLACIVNTPFILPNFAQTAGHQNHTSSSTLVVATFSTLTRTQNVDDIVAFIQLENPNLVCLQELSLNHRRLLLERLDGYYPYQIANNNNQLTLSHYSLSPMDDFGHYQVNTLAHPLWGKIEVVNTHMPRPYLTTGIAESWEKLLKQIDHQSKTILCGDLNITPNNSLYDTLRYRYNFSDSLTSGYGFTYPNAQRRSAFLGPLIRIDYILTRGMRTSNTRTVNVSDLSDHRAVISTIELSEPEYVQR